MNCRDCLHFEVCESISKRESFATLHCAEECPCFTEKSEWVHLPCKVGTRHNKLTFVAVDEEKTKEKHRTYYILRCDCGNLFLHTDLISGIVYTGEVFSESDIGKTVFLTREEAEKALEDMRKVAQNER